nr:Mbeg1-like protein [uncultured Gardnerella sp.]
MPWKVQSSVSGGMPLTVAQSEAYCSVSRKLSNLAHEMSMLSASWQHAAMVISNQTSAFNNLSASYNPSSPFTINASQSFLTPSMCNAYASKCQNMSQNLEQLAALIIRASGIYEEAEQKAKEQFDNGIALLTAIFPITSLPFFISALSSASSDANNHTGLKNVGKWAHKTRKIQQGTIRGLSQNLLINPITGIPLFILGAAQSKRNNRMTKTYRNKSLNFLKYANKHIDNASKTVSSVPFVSGALSLFTAQLNNKKQGNNLTVTKINEPWRKPAFVLPKPGRNLSETLDNLAELGSGNLGVRPPLVNPDAATIAISRFKKADGKTSWLVVIPGTDGKAHSPFGWEQNAEVMSHTPLARKQADSTRMVVEAMKKSGIKSKDPVVLVGHSQGGIVAASIASDYSKQYNIQHVVTAGSPIANHPIAKRTWVTSIEMEDELVPSLDGKENPRRSNWITIHGKAMHVKETQKPLPPGVTRFSGRKYSNQKFSKDGIFVNDVPEEGTLTHDMHYHKAAYDDALQLGSKNVIMHNQHFNSIINGKLESTTLWQGIMH